MAGSAVVGGRPAGRWGVRFGVRGALVLAAFLVFAATAAALRAPLTGPVPGDAGAYLYVGRLLFDGGVPYVDAVDNKGPLTYVLFGLIDLVGGGSSLGVRLALVAFAAVAAVAVAGYVGRLSSWAAGWAAGLAFAVLGSRPWQGASPNTEQFGVAPMALAWWLSTRAGLGSAGGAGALVAAATLMNLGFAFCALPVAFELLRARRAGGRAAAVAAALAGGALVLGAVLGWLALRGGLAGMLVHALGFGGDVLSGGVEVPEQLGRRLAVPHAVLLYAALASCFGASLSGRYRAVGIGAAVWLVVMLGRAKLSPYDGPLYEHHYYPLMPGVAAGLAAGGAAFWSGARRLPRPARAATLAAAAAVLASHYVVAPPDRNPRLGGWQARELVAAADYVRAHTDRDDRILVSGFSPQVYWLARRDAASPVFAVPRFAEAGQAGNFPTIYCRRRLIAMLRRPPAAIVIPGTFPLRRHRRRATATPIPTRDSQLPIQRAPPANLRRRLDPQARTPSRLDRALDRTPARRHQSDLSSAGAAWS